VLLVGVRRTKVSGVVPPDPTVDGERVDRRVRVAQIALASTSLIVGKLMPILRLDIRFDTAIPQVG
jgi:hypothetical protein